MSDPMLKTVTDARNESTTISRAAAAAGALFTDELGRIMLVKPTYKSFWDIPGGYVDAGESPVEACQREISEELGLNLKVGRLLVMDWAPTPGDGDKMLFVFDGGRLSRGDLASIKLQAEEVIKYEYVAVAELGLYTIDRLVRRLAAALCVSLG